MHRDGVVIPRLPPPASLLLIRWVHDLDAQSPLGIVPGRDGVIQILKRGGGGAALCRGGGVLHINKRPLGGRLQRPNSWLFIPAHPPNLDLSLHQHIFTLPYLPAPPHLCGMGLVGAAHNDGLVIHQALDACRERRWGAGGRPNRPPSTAGFGAQWNLTPTPPPQPLPASAPSSEP